MAVGTTQAALVAATQDAPTNFRSVNFNMSAPTKLFDTVQLGPLTLPNRVVMAPPSFQDRGMLSTAAWMQPRFPSNHEWAFNGQYLRFASSSQDMLRMITGYWVTQIVRGAAYYSLADHLER
jgi:hypothetical protein